MPENPSGEPLRYQQVRELFQAALDRPEDERAAFLNQACGHDEALHRQVLDLLKVHAEPDSLLDRPAAEGVTLSQALTSDDPEVWDRFLQDVQRFGPDFARFLDQGEVARGGMGSIHRVKDQSLRRTLAMKILLAREDPGDPSRANASLGRFLEEAQVTSQLDHPGIVPVHDIGLDDAARVYFTMKLVKGEDLRSVFDRVQDPNDDGWNETRALNTLLRVCEAMAYAHEKGVIHRDLKPGNVMVGRHGETYVMDWGLAKVLGQEDHKDLRLRPVQSSSLIRSERKDAANETPDSPLVTMDGDVVGTPSFMAPEQADGRIEEMGPHSDVYALGAMLYQLLTGATPYVDSGARMSARMILARVQSGPPRPLHELRRDVPPELSAICEKAMARSIPDRYATMLELSIDLRAYLENRVVAAYESGAIAELRKWVVRNQGITTTAAAALLLIAALSGWFVVNLRSERNVAKANEQTALEERDRADARTAEFDQLAGVVLLNEAQLAEQELYPAWPENIAAMEGWLSNEAAKLLSLKPSLQQTLKDLEARALPQTPEASEHDRTTHPRFPELLPLTLRLESLRRAQAVRAGGPAPAAAALPAELLSADAKGLNDYAWPRVDPDITKRIFGQEREALAAARAALSRIESGDGSLEKPMLLDTLAWALFENGFDEEARQASASAVEAVPEEQKQAYAGSLETLKEAITAASSPAGLASLSDLEKERAALLAELAERRTWRFESESQRFLHATLSDLSQQIADFEEGEHRRVQQRLNWARRIDELTRDHPNAVFTWADARHVLAAADGVLASKLYRERPIDLQPQLGLVPIGMNPVTKLWEFYHLRSAWDPSSDVDPAGLPIPEHEEDGSIEVQDGTGIVFVLIPGGTFWMGAQKDDPEVRNFDPGMDSDESPVHEVTLEAYFLARHELTAGQWFRLTGGQEPSWHQRGLRYESDPFVFGWTHPVNQVSWEDSLRELPRHGLALPTEAQWERGARAGTGTIWWTGSEVSSLSDAANVLDVKAEAKYPNWGRQQGDFDDGYLGLAPVGQFRFNGFGLFDVAGNVWEWCRDGYGRYTLPVQDGDGLRDIPLERARNRVGRGGGYNIPADGARSASRLWLMPSYRDVSLGLRPARAIHN